MADLANQYLEHNKRCSQADIKFSSKDYPAGTLVIRATHTHWENNFQGLEKDKCHCHCAESFPIV